MTAIVRQVGPDDWRDWRLMRLRSLDEDPTAFSSTTASWSGSNDVEERWRARLSHGACFIAYESETPVGMVAGTTADDGTNQLISMWVAPESRRRGIGAQLIEAVVEWNGDKSLNLRVMDGNAVATSTYERHGFVMLGSDADDEGCRAMVRNNSQRGVRT